MIFTIPINIEVDANNESQAERKVFNFLKDSTKEFANEHRITDWEYHRETPCKSCGCGCGNLNLKQGEPI